MNAGLSCRRPQKPQKSERRLFQISLWLKLAVFFALFVGAAGANNSFKSYDVRGDCPNPCPWTAKGSFSVAVPDDGTCRRQGIPEPIRQCWPGCTGISGCKASVEGFRGSVPRERTYESLAGRTNCRGAGTYNWATYVEELWKVGSGYISKFEDVNEAGKECVGQSPMESYHKCWHGLPYPQNPRVTSRWLGQRGITNRPAEEVVSDIFACYLYGQRGAARCWKEAAYICWYGYGGRGTSNIQKTCPRICRLVCLGCRSKRPRCGVLHSRGTAKQHNGPRPPGDTDVFTSVRGTQGGRSTFITSSFSKQFESSTACLDPGSFVWRGCSTEFAQGISIMCGRSKSEDCGFSAKESCFIVRFSVDATASCFSLDATSCCFSTDASTCLSTTTSTRSFSAGVDSISCCTGQASFGGTSVWVIRVGYGAESSSSKVPSATDASWECVQFHSSAGFYAILAGCLFGRAYSYDSSTYPCWWICGHCSSYHTGRHCGAVGRFISLIAKKVLLLQGLRMLHLLLCLE